VEALRQTMVAMIDGEVGSLATANPAERRTYSYAHPVFWAAYSLYGE
jgi:CHAT domain-containing protein